MRILVVNNFYPPRVGGSAHLSDALARGYAREGHEVLVLTAAFGDAPAMEQCGPNMRIIRMPAAAIPQTRLSVSFDIAFTMRPTRRRRLTALLDGFRPDVIHQHGQFFDLTWATAKYARHHQIPVLLSVHTRLENPKARYQGVFRWLDAFVVAPILRRYRPRIVVMDVQMDEYIKRRYRRGFSGLEYIPVGIDSSRMAGGDAPMVRESNGFGDAPLIVSLGHVIPLRDRVALVEALPKVLSEFPGARLVVVGRVYYDLFLQRARELGVESAVTSVGAVAKAEVPNYLAAATVEAHDLQGYGMGTATLESMAAGVPVIVAVRPDNFPGIDLTEGPNCLLVPLGDVDAIADALISLLGDADARAQIGRNGRQLVHERFDLAVVLKRYLRVLEAMPASPPHRDAGMRVSVRRHPRGLPRRRGAAA
jgi:glycosyltransferase involved in cell wall biosynthesis